MRVNNEVIVAVMIEVILVMIAEIMISCIKENPFLCFSTLYHKKLDFSRRYKMKLYKVTTADQYNRNWVYTVSADSEHEALWKVKANAISSGETVSTIEEVR